MEAVAEWAVRHRKGSKRQRSEWQPGPVALKRRAREGSPARRAAELTSRLERILAEKLEFIDDPTFHRRAAVPATHFVAPAAVRTGRRPAHGNALSADLAVVCATPLLSREQECALFRRMNFLKFQAHRLRRRLRARSASWDLLEQYERLIRESQTVRNELIQANTRLVVSLAKQYVNAAHTFEELFSDGILSLLKAVDKYDYLLGYRFSTYATTAVKNNFHHLIRNRQQQCHRYVTGSDASFVGVTDPRPDERLALQGYHHVRSGVRSVLRRLSEPKRSIVAARFGLTPDGKSETLKQVSQRMGISRERVRQIQAEALEELRHYAALEKVELPE